MALARPSGAVKATQAGTLSGDGHAERIWTQLYIRRRDADKGQVSHRGITANLSWGASVTSQKVTLGLSLKTLHRAILGSALNGGELPTSVRNLSSAAGSRPACVGDHDL